MKLKTNLKLLLVLALIILSALTFSTNNVQASERVDNSNLVYIWLAYQDKPMEEIGFLGSGFDFDKTYNDISLSTDYSPINVYYYISTKNKVGDKISTTKGDLIYDNVYTMYGEKVYVYKIALEKITEGLSSYEFDEKGNFDKTFEFNYEIKDINGNTETFNSFVSIWGNKRETIKLTGDTDTISINGDGIKNAFVEIIKENDDTYSRMTANLYEYTGYGEKDFYNISVYDLDIQGELKDKYILSFDVGTENNGKNAYVCHRKHNGKFENFETTVVNGKIEITVTEFSPFIIALKKETTNENDNTESNPEITTPTETTNNGEKDETPKTGTVDIIGYVSLITLISLVGIVELKKKLK